MEEGVRVCGVGWGWGRPDAKAATAVVHCFAKGMHTIPHPTRPVPAPLTLAGTTTSARCCSAADPQPGPSSPAAWLALACVADCSPWPMYMCRKATVLRVLPCSVVMWAPGHRVGRGQPRISTSCRHTHQRLDHTHTLADASGRYQLPAAMQLAEQQPSCGPPPPPTSCPLPQTTSKTPPPLSYAYTYLSPLPPPTPQPPWPPRALAPACKPTSPML